MQFRFGIRCAALALGALAGPALAAWQTPGRVTAERHARDQVELDTASGARLRVTFIDADTVRVRLAPSGTFARDFSYAVAAVEPPVAIEVARAGETIGVRTAAADSLRVAIATAPELRLEIRDAVGELLLADDPAQPMAFDAATGEIAASKQRDARELYYGFGEKALPLSRHGQFITMWNSDTPGYARGLDPIYQSIPFFIALRDGRSYGLFLDNTWRTHFDMGASAPQRYTFGSAGGELDYYVFGGGRTHDAHAVLRGYTRLTGRGALPPLWALGYQQSRYSYTPDAQVRQIARTFRDKQIPADVIYFDIGYMDGYRIFTWSPQDFPQPAKLLGDLHAQGFHAVTIVDPGVKADGNFPIYRAGRSFYVRDAAGDELQRLVWPGICAFPDFTNARARAWFGSLYREFLEQGVDGFWNDMNEPATFVPPGFDKPVLVHDPLKTFPLDARHDGDGDGGTHARYHNVYGMQMARATFEGLSKLRPQQRPFVLTRAGYAGVQRYAAVWTGDNASTWEHLALSIPMLADLSVSGVPFVGADIGGFTGTPSAELYTRWLQAAALTPFMRTHSAIDTAPREPWTHGEPYERINRATIELRYRLLPYLYSLFADSARDGIPPLRPLWFEFASDVDTYLVEDQFLLGADLLVAPVVHEGETTRRVYFPRGATWIDWWDGTRHDGGTRADVAAPLERLPLFVRAGAALPVSAPARNTAEQQKLPLTLSVAVGADGGGRIYQDAGDGFAAGELTTVAVRGDRLRIDAPPHARFRPIGSIELLGLERAPAKISADGKALDGATFDAATKRLRIDLHDRRVREILLSR